MSDKLVPVTVGEVIEGVIEGTGNKGDKFFRIEGFVVFVKGETEGGLVKVKVTKVLANYAFAELM